MFRRKTATRKKRHNDHIKWRGQEVTRIEAFSDAVFAFAVTLLIVSLEVPHSYDELMEDLRFFLPFSFSFGIMFAVWYQQNIFFRRYGLHDGKTITLNAFLLFFVIMYMFPLKFLFGSFISKKFHFTEPGQFSTVFCLYCGGFAIFYLLFTLMYLNAYARREKLRLTEIEVFQTRSRIYNYVAVTVVSVMAVVIASINDITASLAGCTFWFLWPITSTIGKKRDKLFLERFGENPEAEVVHEHMHAHQPATEH